MGVINRICIHQMKKTEAIIKQRIAFAEIAADEGHAEWEFFDTLP